MQSNNINWKHFGIFYSLIILQIILSNIVGKGVNQHTQAMLFVNLIAMLSTPLMIGVMIYSHKSEKRLNFIEKFYGLLGFMATQFLLTFLFNLINPFSRGMYEGALQEGIVRTGIFTIIMIIFCLPIIALIKSRIKKNDAK